MPYLVTRVLTTYFLALVPSCQSTSTVTRTALGYCEFSTVSVTVPLNSDRAWGLVCETPALTSAGVRQSRLIASISSGRGLTCAGPDWPEADRFTRSVKVCPASGVRSLY